MFSILFYEVMIRTIKNLIRRDLRNGEKQPEEVIRHYMETIMTSELFYEYWNTTLVREIEKRFEGFRALLKNFPHKRKSVGGAFTDNIVEFLLEEKQEWVHRLLKLVGVRLGGSLEDWRATTIQFTSIVKGSYLILFQEAFGCKLKADKTNDTVEKLQLLRNAFDLYLSCLELNTRNDFALFNLSRICKLLSEMENSQDMKTMEELLKKIALSLNPELGWAEADIYRLRDLWSSFRKNKVTK